MYEYYLGFGSNLGNREENIRVAFSMLLDNSSVSNTALYQAVLSPLFITKALLLPDSPPEWDIDYVNGVCRIYSSLEPRYFLDLIKTVEKKIGRDTNSPRWSPRIIDVDILLAYNLTESVDNIIKGPIILTSNELSIPHTEILHRGFVMLPLLEINPNAIHPVSNKPISDYCTSDMKKEVRRL